MTQRGHGIVRTEGLKYIDFLKVQSQRTKPAFFNLTRDPHERNDLSENLAEVLPRLQGLVDAFLAARAAGLLEGRLCAGRRFVRGKRDALRAVPAYASVYMRRAAAAATEGASARGALESEGW